MVMNLRNIKTAVREGLKVHWANELYEVQNKGDAWYIVCVSNGSCVGLTWSDGKTLNGKANQFFISKK
jgi:hypothetical protein